MILLNNIAMATKDEIKLIEKAICGYMPYKVKAVKNNVIHTITAVNTRYDFCELDDDINEQVEDIKLFLRPMSSMTNEEAKDFVNLWGIIDFVSLNITKEYIGVICDDGFSSTTTTEIWYDEDMSIECFDFLNAHHFDYRGLIEKGFALEAPIGRYMYNN